MCAEALKKLKVQCTFSWVMLIHELESKLKFIFCHNGNYKLCYNSKTWQLQAVLFLEHATIKLPELHYYNLPVSTKNFSVYLPQASLPIWQIVTAYSWSWKLVINCPSFSPIWHLAPSLLPYPNAQQCLFTYSSGNVIILSVLEC